MNKAITCIFAPFLFLFGFNTLIAQLQDFSRLNKQSGELPMESVYVHYNTTLFLTGEYIYYSVFCLNNKTKKMSNLSKVAYAELINESGKTIFKHKLRLENGRGQGDFFIPTNVPSGNYKLFAYTQLMLNVEQEHYFQGDLSVVNPYTNAQNALLKKTMDTVYLFSTSSKRGGENKIKDQRQIGDISFLNDRKTFKKREKVTVAIKGLDGLNNIGSYSVSVRKFDDINTINAPSSTYIISKRNKVKSTINSDDITILPEIRGELISGKVIAKEDNLNIDRLKMAISIPGTNYDFKIINTNINGEFYFILNNNYDGNEMVIHLLDNSDKYEILINEQQPLNVSNIEFNSFLLKESMKEIILERSIHNQIENNYFSFRPDSVRILPKNIPFFGDLAKEYVLDEYTRFRTVEETIIEILNDVYVKRLNNENPVIQVRSEYAKKNQSGYLPLVIVDGNYIQNFTDLLMYDARKIEKVSVVTDRYILGPQVFQGIVDIITFDGDYSDTYTNDYSLSYALFKPLQKKSYYNQDYNSEYIGERNRVPDYRHQLLWNPSLELKGDSSEIIFYTSDVSGNFEISLEGFTENGHPISLRDFFSVK